MWTEYHPILEREDLVYIRILDSHEYLRVGKEYWLGPGTVLLSRTGRNISCKSTALTKVKSLPKE